MKKSLILILTLLVGSFINAIAQKQLKAGICVDNFATERWIADVKFLEEEFRQLGIETYVKVSHSDAKLQVKQGIEFVNQRVDILVIIPTDGKQLKPVIDAAKSNKIPVIAYDRLIFDDRIDLYISYDNYEVGRIQAREALKRYPNGNFVLINGPTSDFNASMFAAGQKEILTPLVEKKQIKLVEELNLDDWNELTAYMASQEISTPLKKIDVILSPTDPVSSGVIMGFRDNPDFQGVFLTGQDATPIGHKNIMDGKQDMTILKELRPLAKKAAAFGSELAKGQKITGTTHFNALGTVVPAYFLESLIILDRENIDTSEAFKMHRKALSESKVKE